jgi:hypothetical protein
LEVTNKERIMDIIEQHFAAENAHDVTATLATYTDDLVWDDVGNPACPVQGKSAAAEMYEGIMDAIPDLHLESVSRFACSDHVVDESIATGTRPRLVHRHRRRRSAGSLPDAERV